MIAYFKKIIAILQRKDNQQLPILRLPRWWTYQTKTLKHSLLLHEVKISELKTNGKIEDFGRKIEIIQKEQNKNFGIKRYNIGNLKKIHWMGSIAE